MKLIALVTIFPGSIAPGKEFNAKDADGKDLIERGLAKAAGDQVKPGPSKADPAAGQDAQSGAANQDSAEDKAEA